RGQPFPADQIVMHWAGHESSSPFTVFSTQFVVQGYWWQQWVQRSRPKSGATIPFFLDRLPNGQSLSQAIRKVSIAASVWDLLRPAGQPAGSSSRSVFNCSLPADMRLHTPE